MGRKVAKLVSCANVSIAQKRGFLYRSNSHWWFADNKLCQRIRWIGCVARVFANISPIKRGVTSATGLNGRSGKL